MGQRPAAKWNIEGAVYIEARAAFRDGELSRLALEPGGVALVERRADLLRDRLVRRVADQEVTKPKAAVIGEVPLVRPDQFLADERHQMLADRLAQTFRQAFCDRTLVEDLAFHGRGFDGQALVVAEPVEPGCEERLDRRRDVELAVESLVLHRQREHLLDEERIALRGVDDPRTHPRIELDLLQQLTHEKCTVSRRQRLE